MNELTEKQFLDTPEKIKAASAKGFIRTLAICTGQPFEKAAKVYRVVRQLNEQAIRRQVKVANECLANLKKSAAAQPAA